jgi:putative zinc finger/helix-turn-helix YgiT family protein
MRYEDELHKVEVPHLTAPRCGNCGEVVFTYDTEDQIRHVFRSQLGLLQPEQIANGRHALGLTIAELAERLKVAEGTLVRWESGDELQPRAVDTLLRLYFALPEVRSALLTAKQDPQFGVSPVLSQ